VPETLIARGGTRSPDFRRFRRCAAHLRHKRTPVGWRQSVRFRGKEAKYYAGRKGELAATQDSHSQFPLGNRFRILSEWRYW